MERSLQESRHDTGLSVFFADALISTCEEFAKNEKERGKARLFFEKAKAALESCRKGVLNAIESGQCEYLHAKIAIMGLILENDLEVTLLGLKEMKPAVFPGDY
jgi:hypothetical protein